MTHCQILSYFLDTSIPIQVGTARLLSGVTAEYHNEVGEKYRQMQNMSIGCVIMTPEVTILDNLHSRGLAVLTFPFNLCANVALLSLKAAHTNLEDVGNATNNTDTDNVQGTRPTNIRPTHSLIQF